MKLNSLITKLIIIQAAQCTNSPNSPIKGVSPEDQHKYQPDINNQFQCLSNPEIKISIDKINDDFCDCPDGSDEPGTSACPNGVFYCENKGFKSSYLPSFKVNDGICDYESCCDGSDEPLGVCEDRCLELNEKWETNKKLNNEKIVDGLALKKKILRSSVKLKHNVKNDLIKLDSHIERLNGELNQLREVKNDDYEKVDLESLKLLSGLENGLNELSLRISNELTNDLSKKEGNINKLESILKQMDKDYNHNFNDPAVKLAAQSFNDYSENTNNDKEFPISSVTEMVNSLKKDITKIESQILKEFKKQAIAQEQNSSFFSMSSLKTVCESILKSFLGVQQREPTKNSYSTFSQKEIKSRITKLENELKELQKSQDSKKEQELTFGDESKNGPEDVLLGLMNVCILDKIGDYDYKICYDGDIEQISDRQVTKIGRFTKFIHHNNDQNDSLKMIFENGSKCWNGPIRKAQVVIECGLEDKILTVSEPEKCEYFFKISSPIGCFESNLL